MTTGILPDPTQFARELETFFEALPVRPVLVATIYDPTFGDDRRAFLDVDPGPVRAAHARFNTALASAATQVGQLVDVHAHFLLGSPNWFVQTIEPSLVGASEIRRCYWPSARRVALELTVS
jgi:hypothetical protein